MLRHWWLSAMIKTTELFHLPTLYFVTLYVSDPLGKSLFSQFNFGIWKWLKWIQKHHQITGRWLYSWDNFRTINQNCLDKVFRDYVTMIVYESVVAKIMWVFHRLILKNISTVLIYIRTLVLLSADITHELHIFAPKKNCNKLGPHNSWYFF